MIDRNGNPYACRRAWSDVPTRTSNTSHHSSHRNFDDTSLGSYHEVSMTYKQNLGQGPTVLHLAGW